MATLARYFGRIVLACGLALSASAQTPDDNAALKNQIRALAESQNYREAQRLLRELAGNTEASETANGGKAGTKTAEALGSVAWFGLLAHDFAGALAASDRAISLAPELLWLATNKAHALLFLGRRDEARALYLRHKGKHPDPKGDRQWEDAIEEDFAAFRKAGLEHEAFEEIIRALGIDSRLTAEFATLQSRALALQKEKKYAEAVPVAERVVEVAEKRFGEMRTELAWALDNLALLYKTQGRYAEAEPLLNRSLAIREKALGPNHPDVGTSLNNLALLYQVQGRYAEAEPLQRRDLAITEKTLGPNNPSVATSLNNLAGLLKKQGRYADAVALYKRALAIREKALGPTHPDVGTALHGLADVYQEQGHHADAEQLLNRSLAIYEKALGSNHRYVATALNDLAELHRVRGRYADAESLHKRALAIREKALGPTHPDVAQSLGNLATLYENQARYPDAEPLFKRSLTIFESELGSNDPRVGTVLSKLADLYYSQGRYADAEVLLKRSVAIYEKALGPDHPYLGTSLNNLALLYEAQGRYADAEVLYRRAFGLYEKALGPEHPDVATLLNNLAFLYRAQSRYADAEPLYKRALAVREKAVGPDHPAAALITGNLGSFLKSEGRIDEAAPLLTRALDAGRKALGEDHPQVVAATIQLAELYGLQGRTTEAEALFAKAGAAKAVDLQEFPIYFGTNRKRDRSKKRIAFGIERNLDELTLGVVKVVVPPPAPSPSATRGGTGNSQTAEARVSDLRQLAIQPVELLDADTLVRAARDRLLSARTYLGQALLFVHGYKVSFDNAVRRAGQLAYDIGFDGPVFTFSWPSREKLLSYLGDRESAQLSADALRKFIETVIAETKAKRIHIIAHSMGNVALNEALRSMDAEALGTLNLGEMVLASPDLDPDLFERTYRRLQKRGATSTIYAASSDWALWSSSWLRDRPQLGYIPSEGPKRIVPGTDLIDITAVNADIFSLNHDLYANSPAVIADLRRLMKEGQRPPETRTEEFKRLTVEAGEYWRYEMPASKP